MERKQNKYTFAFVGKSPTYVLHSSYNNRHALRACTQSNNNMAKSKSFFGLRRGSTKDLTFSTYRGQQVTKSRVISVANPQTLYQMEQRMRLVQVANAATKLKGLINHSFEGVPYGQNSISQFRALNLTKGILTPVSWVPKGVGDCGVADFIISKGSLPPIKSEFINEEAKSAPQMELKQVAIDGAAVKDTVANWIEENGLQEGDQLTFLAGFQTGVSVLVDGKAVYFHNFAIDRLIIKKDRGGYLITGNDETNSQWEQVEEGTGEDKTINLKSSLFKFSVGAMTSRLTTNVNFIAQPFASSLNFAFDMFGCILSRKEGDVWRRSFCQLATKTTDDYHVEYDKAAPSYIKSTTSNKFLNLGPQKTGILGDQ